MENFNKKLEKFKENTVNPFSVPDGYFDEFPTKIQEKIATSQAKQNMFSKAFEYIKPQLALGFMIIAFAVISITTINFILSERNKSGLNKDLFTRTIDVDTYKFTEQHFIDVLLEDKKETLKKKEVETDHYINYLVNENIDYDILINEF